MTELSKNKVIIISYFHPPANFVGGERVASWFKYLPRYDIYPIIITRNWNENQTNLVDKLENNRLLIEASEYGEIHRLPFRRSLRDKCSRFSILKPLQKLLTFIELIFSNFSNYFLPYNNFYPYTKKIIDNSPDINTVIISGRPFQSFSIGYRLKKHYPNLNWIPDYRDEWNSHQNSTNSFNSFFNNIITNIESKSEIKWTSNADYFITVSEPWRKSIQNLIKRDGIVIKNGYNKLSTKINEPNMNKVKIIYAGTMYDSQPINRFIEGIINFKNEFDINVHFIGTEIVKKVDMYLKKVTKNHKDIFMFHKRMNSSELEHIASDADLFLLTSFENVKGWYPVKLFDYYSRGKPILLMPSDNGVMEEFINITNSGFFVNNEIQLHKFLNDLVHKKKNGISISYEPNKKEGQVFSRAHQSKILAEFLNNLK